MICYQENHILAKNNKQSDKIAIGRKQLATVWKWEHNLLDKNEA